MVSTFAGGARRAPAPSRADDADRAHGRRSSSAVALFDVLPEAIDAVGNAGRASPALVGARLPLLLPRRARARPPSPRRRPSRPAAHEQVGVLGAAGLSLHSFIDGFGIGLAFGVNTTTGLLVFIAVVAHDFADGMNTVSFILSQSDNRRKALRWLAVDAIAPLHRSDRRRVALGLGVRARGTCSRCTPASSCSWARPIFCRRLTSIRLGCGSR